MFAVLFFAPDAGYLAGPRIGAAVHNVAHSYVGPLILARPAPRDGNWAAASRSPTSRSR